MSSHLSVGRRLRLGCLIGLLFCTVGCDQASKHLARSGLSRGSSVLLPGGWVELRLAENPGSFLSLGAFLPDPARFVIFTLGVGAGLLGLTAYLASRNGIGRRRFVGLSLVAAGGISNLLDRLFHHGRVTDFATVRLGPLQTGIFNVADVMILVGIGAVVWSLRKRRSAGGSTNETQQARL